MPAFHARNRLLAAILSAAILCWPGPRSEAATLAGVTLPDSYPVDGQKLVLNGMGLRTVTLFHVRVYVAGLYLARPDHDAQQILKSTGPKVVLMHFLHSGTKAQVQKQYVEGEENNCGDGSCAPSDKADYERLIAAAPAVAVGDRLIYVFTAGRVRVYFNTQMIADFTNPDLAYHLLAGFIGSQPPSRALRGGLLATPED